MWVSSFLQRWFTYRPVPSPKTYRKNGRKKNRCFQVWSSLSTLFLFPKNPKNWPGGVEPWILTLSGRAKAGVMARSKHLTDAVDEKGPAKTICVSIMSNKEYLSLQCSQRGKQETNTAATKSLEVPEGSLNYHRGLLETHLDLLLCNTTEWSMTCSEYVDGMEICPSRASQNVQNGPTSHPVTLGSLAKNATLAHVQSTPLMFIDS